MQGLLIVIDLARYMPIIYWL